MNIIIGNKAIYVFMDIVELGSSLDLSMLLFEWHGICVPAGFSGLPHIIIQNSSTELTNSTPSSQPSLTSSCLSLFTFLRLQV